jgi:hypothetical protein
MGFNAILKGQDKGLYSLHYISKPAFGGYKDHFFR